MTNGERSALSKKRHPGRVRANVKVKRATRRGTLLRGPCLFCGTTEDIHGHHEDLEYPVEKDLDVIWLCRSHHGERHAQLNRIALMLRGNEMAGLL